MVELKNMSFLNNCNFKKISGDASFREFYRGSQSILVYSKKQKKKNLLIYDSINRILQKNKINAPKLIKENYKNNYIEIQDLGNTQALGVIKKKKNKKDLYKEIISLLIKIQKIKEKKITDFKGKQYKIPFYNRKLIFDEAKLFIDWYIPNTVKTLNNSHNKKNLRRIIQKLISKLQLSKRVLVHRDFHISNIMIYKKKMYLIDSQDAVLGNIAYDLASLVDDVRFKTGKDLKEEIYDFYMKKNKHKINKDKFKNDFEILSVLRNLKIIGIFTRLAKRDNKKTYLKMIPYCWKLIQNRAKDKKVFKDLRIFLARKEFRKFIKFNEKN